MLPVENMILGHDQHLKSLPPETLAYLKATHRRCGYVNTEGFLYCVLCKNQSEFVLMF